MKKVIQTNHIAQAFLLLAEIKNKGLAEFTTSVMSFSSVNDMNINLYVPKWEKGKGFSIQLDLSLDLVGKNNDVISQLTNYRDNGFDNDPIIKDKLAKHVAIKKAKYLELKKEFEKTA
jgi:hypothetical protein